MTTEKIVDFAGKYKGGDEERRDVLSAYTKFKGDLNNVFKEVMLSSVLDDEERFRGIIDSAVEGGEVKGYDAYVNESEKKKTARRRQAEKAAKEAEKHAEFLGVNGKKGGKKGKEVGGGEADLAAMMQQRQKGRAANFLDDLEAKYAAPKAKGGRGRKRQSEEPPEEAFQQMGSRAKKQKKEVIEEDDSEDEEGDGDEDLRENDSEEENDGEDSDEDSEEDDVKPVKGRRKSMTRKEKAAKRGEQKPMQA